MNMKTLQRMSQKLRPRSVGSLRMLSVRQSPVEDEDLLSVSSEDLDPKVVILGTHYSGKTTLFRQFSAAENAKKQMDLQKWRTVIMDNILTGLKGLEAMFRTSKTAEEEADYERLRALESSAMWTGSNEEIQDRFSFLAGLWEKQEFRSVWQRRMELKVNDVENMEYFMENLERIGDLEYVPSHEDILRVHTRTSGIVEGSYMMGDTRLQIVEAGGCRSERRKWQSLFDGVSALIYVVDASAYDATLFEDSRSYRINDAVETFHWLLTTRINPLAPIILFMNKVDVLRKKLQYQPFDISEAGFSESVDFSVEAGVSPDLAVEHALDSLRKAFLDNPICESRRVIPLCSSALATETFDQIVEILEDIVQEE